MAEKKCISLDPVNSGVCFLGCEEVCLGMLGHSCVVEPFVRDLYYVSLGTWQPYAYHTFFVYPMYVLDPCAL